MVDFRLGILQMFFVMLSMYEHVSLWYHKGNLFCGPLFVALNERRICR